MSIFQRLFGTSPAPQRGLPPQPDAHACPLCGSSQLLTQRRESRAERRLDAENLLAVDFTATQLNCAACGKLINDDVSGITAAAYRQLNEDDETPPAQIPEMVYKAMQHATNLPALADQQRQQDYEQVREPWGCLGMRHVPASDLQNALTRLIRGYFAEGATEFEVETLEQQVVMLSFYNARGWRPVRFSRTRDGGFSFYGQVCLYRYLDGSQPKPNMPARPAATPPTQANPLDTTHPVFGLTAGMSRDAVIGLLGEDYRSTTARKTFENPARARPGVVDIIDPSVLDNEYWLYSDQGHYIEIIFNSGSLISAEVKKRNADNSETLLARIDQEGLAAAEPYRAALGANHL